VERLARAGVPFGAYANAGEAREAIGWGDARDADGAARYVAHARDWAFVGATIIGGCCGTSPAHVEALARAFSDAHGA
jgi:S-methylmethionine-dependent homocysteine/selenocysteine methylase